ncbi:MAG: hypothetical protein OEQ39_04885 [Gammaproteobacteria bacterium]|nr:hypothetical protein [Gammaproteobacteria bacterium]
MNLNTQYHGMSFVWNVSAAVGDNASCANRPTDIDLVKILIGETIRARPPAWIHASMRTPLLVNGQMDAITAYWIRVFNADHSPRLSQSLSGIVSPARGAAISPGDTWTIVKLNWATKQGVPAVWNNLPNHPQAKAALAAELQRTQP